LLKVGTKARDGGTFVGSSPTVGKPMYVETKIPGVDSQRMSWIEAMKTDRKQNEHAEWTAKSEGVGRPPNGSAWHLPTVEEAKLLNEFFNTSASGKIRDLEEGMWTGTYREKGPIFLKSSGEPVAEDRTAVHPVCWVRYAP